MANILHLNDVIQLKEVAVKYILYFRIWQFLLSPDPQSPVILFTTFFRSSQTKTKQKKDKITH